MYMATEPAVTPVEGMDSRIHFIRGQRVMLDSDLAFIYGVSTKQLNQQLRRNLRRFPSDFAFRLTAEEFSCLRSQIVTSNGRGGRRYLPGVFTEHGAIMLAAVLNSQRAIDMSLYVVRAFIQMRELLNSDRHLAVKLAALEERVGSHDRSIAQLVAAIRKLLESPAEDASDKPKREIGFHMRETAPPYRISRRR
jgi:hypothetical protein